jgi:hypothetical protein
MPSTVIAHFTYSERNAELVVKFRSGKRYAYERVPSAVYVEFCKADSKGSFFNREIRDRYPTRQLAPDVSDRP